MLNKFFKYAFLYAKSYARKLIGVKTIQLHGIKVNLVHRNISPELRNFFYEESYEGDEITILKKHLEKDDVLMEIGAGIGFLSAFCAKQIGSENVYAYEANPFMMEKILETYKLNNVNPSISNVLLLDGEGEVDFYLENNFWSSSTIERTKGAKKISVTTRDINDDIKKIDPTLLIVDVEGGELDLIPIIDFHNIKRIIIEVHPHVIGNRNSSEIVGCIISKGFSLCFDESRNNVFLFKKDQL